jgi:hypothetical protein
MNKTRSTGWIVAFLAVLNIVIHLAFYNNLEYHRDELLYFSLGEHPAWGYASIPPATGLLAWLVSSLFGYSIFAVRLLPAIFSGALVVVSSQIAVLLGGRYYAQILTNIAIIVTPVFLRTFFLFQPVYLDIFLWSLLFYWLIRFQTSNSNGSLYGMGITLGIAMLNKYLIIVALSAILLSWVVTHHRTVFNRKALYGAAAIAFSIFLPNLIWQFTHDFPVIQHMEALQRSQLVHVSRSVFLGEQLLLSFSVLILVLPGLILLYNSKRNRSVTIAVVLVLFFLWLARGKSYYAAGIYPVLIAAGAVWWEKYLVRPFSMAILPVVMIGLILPILPIGLPIYKVDGLIRYFQKLEDKYGIDVGRRFEDGTIHALPQDYADMLGWEELTQIVDKAYKQTGNKENVLIYCENYGQAGAVAIIGKKYNLPEPVSFHESFFYWAPNSLKKEVREFIYVNDELGEDIPTYFADIREIGRIQNPYAREFGTRVYLCRQPKVSLKAVVEKRLKSTTPF